MDSGQERSETEREGERKARIKKYVMELTVLFAASSFWSVGKEQEISSLRLSLPECVT